MSQRGSVEHNQEIMSGITFSEMGKRKSLETRVAELERCVHQLQSVIFGDEGSP